MNNKEYKIIPQIKNDIETDVLIIGGGISGALGAYIFNEKGIDVTVIDNKEIFNNIPSEKIYDIDVDINALYNFIEYNEFMDAYRLIIDAFYKLDLIIEKIEDKCDYKRQPGFSIMGSESQYIFSNYQVDKINKDIFENLSIHYDSSAVINPIRFTNEVFNYCLNKNVKVYEKTDVYEISIENDDITVITSNKYKIKCNKILVTTNKENSLFFDKPIESVVNSYAISKNQNINIELNDINLSNEINEPHFYLTLNKNEERNYNILYNNTDEEIPFIGIHDKYDNIYFNTNTSLSGLLYSLIGSMLICDEYISTIDNNFQLYHN